MAKVVTNFNFDGCEWRVVERTDSPNSPYYVIEKKGKDAMDQPTYLEGLMVFPPTWEMLRKELRKLFFIWF